MSETVDIPGLDQLIVFSDLDGTLLDHETYSFAPAQEALAELRKHQVPLILASSKTAAEIEPLRTEIGFEHFDAIVENGAGILSSCPDVASSSDTYERLLEKLSAVPAASRKYYKGFSQWTTEEISTLTGLSSKSAVLSKKRQFSEPGIWSGNEAKLKIFLGYLADQGIVAQSGGRFLTLSFGGNKVDQMQKILTRFGKDRARPFSVVLGDAPNDLAMLKAADLGIIIPNPAHDKLGNLSGTNILHAPFAGPQGWNIAVLDVLKRASSGETFG